MKVQNNIPYSRILYLYLESLNDFIILMYGMDRGYNNQTITLDKIGNLKEGISDHFRDLEKSLFSEKEFLPDDTLPTVENNKIKRLDDFIIEYLDYEPVCGRALYRTRIQSCIDEFNDVKSWLGINSITKKKEKKIDKESLLTLARLLTDDGFLSKNSSAIINFVENQPPPDIKANINKGWKEFVYLLKYLDENFPDKSGWKIYALKISEYFSYKLDKIKPENLVKYLDKYSHQKSNIRIDKIIQNLMKKK